MLFRSQNGRFTLSDDSHGPLAVGLHYDKTFEYIRDRNLAELYCLVEEAGVDGGRPAVVPVVVPGKPWLEDWPARIVNLEV